MSEVIEADFIIPVSLGEQRLDRALAELMPEHSRSRIQGWIKTGAVTVNGQVIRPRDKVSTDDVVGVHAEVESQERWEAEDIAIDIIYEDDDIIVLNKPAGLVVHPAAGHASGTLVNALLHHYPDIAKLPRAGIVHRLDKDTTGLMVVAKSLVAHTSIVDQLQTRTMGREYEAVVTGVMTGGGCIEQAMARHPQNRIKMAVHPFGKPAVTHYRLIERFDAHTHIRLKLETGRTHQIRVHMTHLHYPLVGDPVYGGRLRLPAGASEEVADAVRHFKRQALHAKKLTLIHPATGKEMSWEVDLPDDMLYLLEMLKQHHAEE
ncbi:23S rRNA pseudouridine(1911/1915/1917) synthase RluD [Alkalimarinus alittae]|uniref:Pseudouridine synthase n=1 Tax=Alkalimarinus alittae TaxID=2961619 RepID=A0ABY6N0H4_9ALTE|nr:23S rRNA pseudouridine(1911/1915/1917) synthase RluD [Alkalimarinus alittae]UZE95593.1 23S rRNA pseudouridine(1911/1915/1917) synthase RluD [Alkalimarinus alittae]